MRCSACQRQSRCDPANTLILPRLMRGGIDGCPHLKMSLDVKIPLTRGACRGGVRIGKDVCVTWISIAIAAIALIVAACGLTAYVLMRRQAEALEMRIADLAAELDGIVDAPPAPPVPVKRNRPLITIEILNPLELAASQVRAASLVGSWKPDSITKMVYNEAAKQIAAQLVEEGVIAEVLIHAED